MPTAEAKSRLPVIVTARQKQAMALRDAGVNWKQAAAQMGIDFSTYFQMLKRADAALAATAGVREQQPKEPTITADEIAKLAGTTRGVVYRWERDSKYTPGHPMLEVLGYDRKVLKNGKEVAVKRYSQFWGERGAENFNKAKRGIFPMTDPWGKEFEYLAWGPAAVLGGKNGKPLNLGHLMELAARGVVHRQRALYPGYRSKHGKTPWVYHSGHLIAYSNGDRRQKFDPKTDKLLTREEVESAERIRKQGDERPHWFDGKDWYERPGALKIAECSYASLNNWTPPDEGSPAPHKCPHLPNDIRCIRRKIKGRDPALRRLWLGDDLRVIRKANKLPELPIPKDPNAPVLSADERIQKKAGKPFTDAARSQRIEWLEGWARASSVYKGRGGQQKWCEDNRINYQNFRRAAASLGMAKSRKKSLC